MDANGTLVSSRHHAGVLPPREKCRFVIDDSDTLYEGRLVVDFTDSEDPEVVYMTTGRTESNR
jgi:hypothetical protein